jgi:hypothetical protein
MVDENGLGTKSFAPLSSGAKTVNIEKTRLEEDRLGAQPWRRWGPYVSERQWGTVREDYSATGDAWNYFTHDMARSRAYRWGEDGLAGFSDDQQRLCLALVLWNGKDPILKERLFGLSNSEGNHGEDVKEIYYYLDATPTNSYLKMLYKYPQNAYPYDWLVEENAGRSKEDGEFEVIDTGVFNDDRYFDVFVEYAKAGPEDILMTITAHNRGPEAAPLHVIPQVWFRNTWSWSRDAHRPRIQPIGPAAVGLESDLGIFWCHADGAPELLFCDNDTNVRRIDGETDAPGYFKDAFHDYLLHGQKDAVNPARTGTKAGFHYPLDVPAQGSVVVRLRLAKGANVQPFADFDAVVHERLREANEFFKDLEHGLTDDDAKRVHRQALAGMIWSKQFYQYDIRRWLQGDPTQPPPPPERAHGRNHDWSHLNNADVISMPDKWEYPWYASWDLAFHCLPLTLIDPEFAKDQLVRLTRGWYMHPTGQLPAYEWNFSDVNPPVHAWAAYRVFQIDRNRSGRGGDYEFLERIFHKLLLNFTWWVNRKDANDRNIFQGGFLGLDNIGVFDRNKPLPDGGYLDQADGTSWMAMYCLNLMRIALELAMHDPVYQDIATKFFEHFLQIAQSMTGLASSGDPGIALWDDQDEFYYDAITFADQRRVRLKVRSLVGLIPLFAVETIDASMLSKLPDFQRRLKWYMNSRPDLCGLVSQWEVPGVGRRGLLSLLRGHRMKKLLSRMLDETEFLSEFGVRGVSRYHLDHPYVFNCGGEQASVDYEPGESTSNMFGGNSNWRGPIWMPVNFLIIESLQKFHHYYGDDFTVECPTGSGKFLTLLGVSEELTRRLTRLFLRDDKGRRAVFGANEKFQTDPHFRDYVPFFEYFHGDNGRGLGASHQTGWTGLIAKLLQPRRTDH